MKTKVLYVLVSTLKDYYAEQAYLSIYSLKQHTLDCFISLLVDSETSKLLYGSFPELIHSVNEYKVIELDNKLTNKEKSRVLKTTMRQYIDGDFLFIDCDTIVCENIAEIDEWNYDLASVLDCHVPVNRHWAKGFITKNYNKCHFKDSIAKEYHFNSGVIYCKDNANTRKFFNDWATLMKKSLDVGVNIDQPSFNHADTINDGIIQEIKGEWNCQLVQGGVKYLSQAKIIHYFASNTKFRNPYLLADNTLLDEIKKTKQIPNKCLTLLSNPKSAVDANAPLLSSDISMNLYFHQPFIELIYLYNHNRFLYNILRGIFGIFGKLHK